MPRRWKCYKCHRSVRVTDIPHSGKHSSGCSSWLCKVWCSLVLAFGCDFSVSSTISHRELVKSSACRLPALISWNVKMCFSAAVIIILGTQAQTNPQLHSEKKGMRKAERFWLHICLYFNNGTIWRGKERKEGWHAWTKGEMGKKKASANISFNLKCLLFVPIWDLYCWKVFFFP